MKSRGWLIITVLAVFIPACSSNSGGSNSPTSPPSEPLVVTQADLLVDGAPVGGRTMGQGHGEGQMARFEARLRLGPGPGLGYPVWVEYERPMGMGPHQGRFRLYDDGTHGDPVPGDGIYCLEDPQGLYACHRKHAHHGDYHYEFYGHDEANRETNRVRVTVRIAAGGGGSGGNGSGGNGPGG